MSERTNIRLAQLSVRPQYAEITDTMKLTAVQEAEQMMSLYLNRDDPGEPVDAVVVEMACIRLNRLGAEGSSTVKEGDVMRAWELMPDSIKALLDAYRRPMWPKVAQ